MKRLGLVLVLLAVAALAPDAFAEEGIRVPLPIDAPAAPILGNEIVISGINNEKLLPAVAYNSKHDEYLVVWENKWPGNRDIYAQRVNSDGRLLSWFAVSAGPGDRVQPSVAYDTRYDRYLVAWSGDYSGSGNWDIYGRFIPWNGPSVDLVDFSIVNWDGNQSYPKVAYAYAQGGNGEFLVVWHNSGDPSFIGGRRVQAAGGFPAAAWTISKGTEARDGPSVAYNLNRNEYLVVWTVFKSSADIYGVRLRGDGLALGGGEFSIAGWPDNESFTSVASCYPADQYLVAWQSLRAGTLWDIFARFVRGDGTVDSVHQIQATTDWEEDADVSCMKSGVLYLLIWKRRNASFKYGIEGRLVSVAKTMPPPFGIVSPSLEADRVDPTVAGSRNNFLVAWKHQREVLVYYDIHGRLITPIAQFFPFVMR